MDSALRCLALVARQHGLHTGVERLRREHGLADPEPAYDELLAVAAGLGLAGQRERLDWAGLAALRPRFPLLARLNNGLSVLLVALRGGGGEGDGEVQVLDPLAAEGAAPAWVPRARFEAVFSGDALLLKAPRADAVPEGGEGAGFGWRWFVREVQQQRSLFVRVVWVALALQFLAFVPAIFSQMVYDKVIPNGAYATLHVLFTGALLALGFHAGFGLLRALLLLWASSRLDMRSADFSFRRLLALPLQFFQHTPAGTLAKHMQQTASIREFVTGNLLLTLIELLSLVVVLPVLFFFSWQLTGVVCAFALAIGANTFVGARGNRERLTELYRTEGRRQAVLTETLHGMEAVKTMALEPQQQRDWLALSGRACELQYRVGRRTAIASEISGFLMRAMTVVLVWGGALLLLERQMTIGALIAFTLLAQRVTGPLVQMAQLLAKYQQMAISMRMLAGLLNQAPERARADGIAPRLEGAVRFERVGYAYPGHPREVLSDIELDIAPGQRIGVVGRSGSGKSTLVKLLTGLAEPGRGVLRIDGHDLREFDLAHYRGQIGVVSQKGFLFHGTVRDNIAKARRGASLEEVTAAARLAGAAGFIEDLPRGYDTLVEEDGANLSGGQRQRLALARALLGSPRILILDEATSALDPESEAAFRRQLPQIAQGRTLIHVSHRLALLADMDAIAVLDAGRLVDFGAHAQLLRRCALYRQLWQSQHAGSPA